MIRLRPANYDDVINFYGKPFKETFKGYVMVQDAEIIGIAGIVYTQPAQMISVIKDELRKYPLLIMKAAKLITKLADDCPYDVFARASETEKNSDNFLIHLGFVHLHGDIYQWVPQQYR